MSLTIQQIEKMTVWERRLLLAETLDSLPMLKEDFLKHSTIDNYLEYFETITMNKLRLAQKWLDGVKKFENNNLFGLGTKP